jgi:WD40 repeat protein
LVRLSQPAGVVDVAFHWLSQSGSSGCMSEMDVSNRGNSSDGSSPPSAGGEYNIIVARDDGIISVLNSSTLETSTELVAHDDIVSRLCPALHDEASSEDFASVGWDGLLCLWRLDQGADPISSYRTPGVHLYDVSASSFQNNLLSTVGNDSFVRLWDTRSIGDGCSTLVDLGQIGTSCAFSSAKDCYSVVGLLTGEICLIDWRMPDLVLQEPLHKGRINRMRADASHPGRFVTASDDGCIALFESSAGSPHSFDVSLLKAHDDYVTDAIVSESFVYSCSVDKTIRKNRI